METIAPGDRGTYEHLLGTPLPALQLDSTAGRIELSEFAGGLLVLFIYPHATGCPMRRFPAGT